MARRRCTPRRNIWPSGGTEMRQWKRWIRPALFFAGGALAGLAWYQLFGCNGTCVISSSPVRSMLYLGVLGWLLGIATGRREERD